jgi:hypothetical protein
LLAQVYELDSELVSEITSARRELEPIVAQVLPLLRQVIPLHERCIDVAQILAPDALGDADAEMVSYLWRVTGAGELYEVVGRLAATVPRGSVRTENL